MTVLIALESPGINIVTAVTNDGISVGMYKYCFKSKTVGYLNGRIICGNQWIKFTTVFPVKLIYCFQEEVEQNRGYRSTKNLVLPKDPC